MDLATPQPAPPSAQSHTSITTWVVRFVLVAIAYALLARVGLWWSSFPGVSSPLWPAAGVALAAGLAWGPRVLPAVAVGQMIALTSSGMHQPLGMQVAFAVGNTIAAVVAALELRRLRVSPQLRSLRDIVLLFAGGVSLGLISAGLATATLLAMGKVPLSSAPVLLVGWCLGDMTGALLVAPALLTAPALWRSVRRPEGAAVNAAVAAAVLAVVTASAAGIFLTEQSRFIFGWMMFPPLVLAALSLRLPGAAVAMLIVAVICCWGTTVGRGPLSLTIGPEYGPYRFAPLQQALGIASLTTLILAVIADERRGEERVRAAHRELEAMFETSGAALVELDPKSAKFLRVNGQMAVLTGYTKHELLSRTAFDLTHPDDDTACRSFMGELLRGERADFKYEKRYLRKDRGTVWVAVHATLLRDARGRPAKVFCVIHDMTERRAQEQELRLAHERQRLAAEAARVSYWSWDLRTDMVTHGGAKAAAARQAEPLGDAEAWVHPDDLPALREAARSTIVTGQPCESEFRAIDADGQTRWVVSRGMLHRDPAGRPTHLIGVAMDVTEMRQTRERLADSERRLRTQIERMPVAMITNEPDLTFTGWNPAAERIFGWTADEVIGRSPFGTIIPAQAKPYVDGALAELTPESPFNRAVNENRTKDGRTIICEWTNTALFNDAGELTGYMAMAQDVTERETLARERQRLYEQEQAARLAAEQATRLKDDFLATVSHELRTPLTAIVGWSTVLRDSQPDAATTAEAVDAIHRNARVQAQLVEDLLDMSRILAGRLRLERTCVRLREVVSAAVTALAPLATEAGVRVTVAFDEADDVAVSGDPLRLQQVAWNLLSNALKFSPRGGEVRVALGVDPADPVAVKLSVEDEGVGFPADFLPLVFERFRQADASITRKYRGLGLGLSICKHIVEAHGGTITAHSDGPGRGARFDVRLPMSVDATAAHAVEVPPAPVRLDGAAVLLVDDDDDTRRVVGKLLADAGAVVTAAADATSALELLANRRFDALVSDIGMPDLDGYALVRTLRGRPADEGGDVPAVALTALARPEDRRRALAAGFQAHVTKPVEPHALVSAVAALVTATNGHASNNESDHAPAHAAATT